ncbi:hypothetical protein F2P56_020190, partial [Juglans regia]
TERAQKQKWHFLNLCIRIPIRSLGSHSQPHLSLPGFLRVKSTLDNSLWPPPFCPTQPLPCGSHYLRFHSLVLFDHSQTLLFLETHFKLSSNACVLTHSSLFSWM